MRRAGRRLLRSLGDHDHSCMTKTGEPPAPAQPAPDAAALRGAIDQSLHGFLAQRRDGLSRLAPASGALVDLVSEVVATGGKRLRPALCWCGYQAAGGSGDGEAILQAAASLELLHTFAIIHDDVMDQAVLRRGRPALHRRLADERRGAGHGADADLFGISVAVLAGDLALTLSDAMLATSGFPPEALARAAGPLDGMRSRAIAGQYLDVLHAGPGPHAPVTSGDAARIGRLKTAGYSVAGPLAVGAALAGATPEVEEALAGYGAALGDAFSLGDDLLGLFGDAATTGKDAESDLRRGKPTNLIAEALARATGEDRRVLTTLWGDPAATAGDLAAVRAAVRSTGALDIARARIDALVGQALTCLGVAGILRGPAGPALAAIAEEVRSLHP